MKTPSLRCWQPRGTSCFTTPFPTKRQSAIMKSTSCWRGKGRYARLKWNRRAIKRTPRWTRSTLYSPRGFSEGISFIRKILERNRIFSVYRRIWRRFFEVWTGGWRKNRTADAESVGYWTFSDCFVAIARRETDSIIDADDRVKFFERSCPR